MTTGGLYEIAHQMAVIAAEHENAEVSEAAAGAAEALDILIEALGSDEDDESEGEL